MGAGPDTLNRNLKESIPGAAILSLSFGPKHGQYSLEPHFLRACTVLNVRVAPLGRERGSICSSRRNGGPLALSFMVLMKTFRSHLSVL